MAHFCGFIKLIFLLLMLARMLAMGETRPQQGRSSASSDLIAGNEFLKLFMGHEELERELYNRRQVEAGSGGVSSEFKDSEEFDKKSAETGRTREAASRSLKIQGPKSNQAEGQAEDSKQAAKVKSGSKIAFLEDYDENDAILDAEAREIDLKKEKFKTKEDYKVVSVSVSSSSSSSQRGTTTAKNHRMAATTSKYDNKSYTSTKPVVTVTPRPPTATTNKPSSSTSTSTSKSTKSNTAAVAAAAAVAAPATGDNFINRSHKSEFSVEEVQPSAAKQHHQLLQQQRKPQHHHKARKQYTRHRTYPITSVADTLEALDSENSASTNVQNVLASPLQPAASLRSTSTVTTTSYHSGQRNVSINHDMSSSRKANNGDISKDIDQQQSATGVDDQLLPFQTVIYHDTKGGHGPQSRSISYSSISQNVEDLKKWHQSGILAEARRNVSESLKPLPAVHQSEPAKFYSQPSKMYSEPSKFYSEPAKIYSEPSKIYGEPEKFYSEPAKVYGQPSKFYGEPSKVYSQPSKMYGEPAKTYWPVTLTTSTSTDSSTASSTSRPITTTNSPQITTTPAGPIMYSPSRKPAIVSRIAFGEAHSTSSSSTSTSTSSTTTSSTTTTAKPAFGSYQHNHQRTYGHRQPPSAASASALNENASSAPPSRRILFNLDRLPYDLLNAPQPATQQPTVELPKPQQQQTLTYQQQPQQRHHNINPCLDSAVSSLFSSSTLSAHPALIKQRQQHSSLSDQQHSNQNAKGLPNEDLVRCVAEISNIATVSPSNGGADGDGGVQFTTERSNIEELFTPTPEQNYEMEESVSVMTNGRAHGRNSLTLPTTPPPPPPPAFKPSRQRVHFGTNINGGGDAVAGTGSGGGHLSQSFNTNANANGDAHGNSHSHSQQSHRNLHAAEGNTSPDYNNSYDDGDGGDNEDNANDDYTEDDDTARHRGSAASDGGNGDDSKVAYVVEGRNYRKYRVEEKTDDGFIVGEYGVVDHNDGNLRGVRYTADSTINRSLIQKALLTFLKLK